LRNAIQDKQKAASAWRPHDYSRKIVPATFQEVRHQRRLGLDELLMARKSSFGAGDVKGFNSQTATPNYSRATARVEHLGLPQKRGAWRAERRSLHCLASLVSLSVSETQKAHRLSAHHCGTFGEGTALPGAESNGLLDHRSSRRISRRSAAPRAATEGRAT